MQPTFDHGDHITVDENYYLDHSLKKNDLVAIKLQTQDIPQIKRVIATEGDEIFFQNNSIVLNNHVLDEPYLLGNVSHGQVSILQNQLSNFNNIVPENRVLILGDNRLASMDSSKFGLIPITYVKGKVIIKNSTTSQ